MTTKCHAVALFDSEFRKLQHTFQENKMLFVFLMPFKNFRQCGLHINIW